MFLPQAMTWFERIDAKKKVKMSIKLIKTPKGNPRCFLYEVEEISFRSYGYRADVKTRSLIMQTSNQSFPSDFAN